MIGYYIHHHGRGHETRSSAISAYVENDVTALTSMSLSNDTVYSDVVRLARDDEDPHPVNPTADGRLHWVPQHDEGLSDRMHVLAEWIHRYRPSAIVVDVSVEVAALAKLFGVPVIVVAMPGNRIDPPHDLVYGLADQIIAAWPSELYTPAWLVSHSHKTTFVGGISRFDGCPDHIANNEDAPLALVLSGAGGSDLTIDTVSEWQQCNPEYRWQAMGVPGTPWVMNPWRQLCEATVVISGAGQNSIADIATAQRPAVIVPQRRPFNEQISTAGVLERNGLAIVRSTWPESQQWTEILEQARHLDTHRWCYWRTGGAAQRAAAVIDHVADRARASKILT
jgi:UDP-N-acetylglucosamine--N-acetylmuramyl-(pentapeptide) pyrophosphoryl-undecaprenol N-acetylglucosamine transferase